MTLRGSALPCRRRAVAAVLAWTWLAAPLLAIVHTLHETHRYCAEHGALEEAGGVATAAAAPTDGPRAGGEDRAAHHECSFGRVCRFGRGPAPVVLAEGALLRPGEIVPPPPRAPFAARGMLLARAPKTSPPFAG